VYRLEADGQFVGVGGMQQALAVCGRPLRTQVLLGPPVEHDRHQALADRRCRCRLTLDERVQDDADPLTPIDGDGPRTAFRPRGCCARSWRCDVPRLVRQGSM